LNLLSSLVIRIIFSVIQFLSIYFYFYLTFLFFSNFQIFNFFFFFSTPRMFTCTNTLWLGCDWIQSFLNHIAILNENITCKWLLDILRDTKKILLWNLTITFDLYFEIWNGFLEIEVNLISHLSFNSKYFENNSSTMPKMWS